MAVLNPSDSAANCYEIVHTAQPGIPRTDIWRLVLQCKCMAAANWSAVAQRSNAGLAIKGARVRIPFATVSKFEHFGSLHDAPVHSAV